MTQDQRYDMITEMYEATRYAKEIHKKKEECEKREKKLNKLYDNTSNEKMRKEIRARLYDNDYDHHDAKIRDSISYGKKYKNDPYHNLSKGKDAAEKQPGRYNKHEERKPGAYLNAQRAKRDE